MISDVAAQQRDASVLGERLVIRADTERREDLGQRAPMDLGVLADVEPRVVKAEHLDLADHVMQVAGCGEAPGAVDQAALTRRSSAEQLGRLRVAAGVRCRVARTRSRTKVSARR